MRLWLVLLVAPALVASLWVGLRLATCELQDPLQCIFTLPERPAAPLVRAPVPPMPESPAPGPDSVPSDTATITAPAEPAPVIVRSHAWPAELHYPLARWNVIDYRVGHVDTAVLEPGGRQIIQEENATVPPGSELVLSGWAGHPLYGVRMSHVLFAMCGSVVGAAPVGLARSDVAAAVHPNLGDAGWRARLATDALPRCGDSALRVLALAPSGYNVFPLFETVDLEILPAVRRPDGRPVRYDPVDRPVSPESRSAPELVEIVVTAGALRIRRCGSTDCDVVGRLEGGRHSAFVIDEAEGWMLIQAGPQVGWIAGSFVQTVERN